MEIDDDFEHYAPEDLGAHEAVVNPTKYPAQRVSNPANAKLFAESQVRSPLEGAKGA